MPLVPPVTPAEVEALGALVPNLFLLPDQPSLDATVQLAIDDADAWMVEHLGGAYGLAQRPSQVTLQRRACMYLALESLADTLKARKTYGSQFAYDSEESAAYENLITTDWGQRALIRLDTWITVEKIGVGFSPPYFGCTNPTPTNSNEDGSGLDPLVVVLEDELSYSRGISPFEPGTVRR